MSICEKQEIIFRDVIKNILTIKDEFEFFARILKIRDTNSI